MENYQEKHQTNNNEKKKMTTKKDDSGYTPQEEQFADGKGTQLNEELKPDQSCIKDEDDLDLDLQKFKKQEK